MHPATGAAVDIHRWLLVVGLFLGPPAGYTPGSHGGADLPGNDQKLRRQYTTLFGSEWDRDDAAIRVVELIMFYFCSNMHPRAPFNQEESFKSNLRLR